jgi:hypothetical protein
MIKIIEAIYEMLGPEVTKSADDSPRKRAKMIFEKMGKWLSNITKFINFLIF